MGASPTAADADGLASPSTPPQGPPLLVFDGDCGFCTSSAMLGRRFLPAEVGVEPWQRLDLDDLGLTVEQVQQAAYFVDADGAVFGGHAAIGRAMEFMNRPLAAIGWLIRRPPVSFVARPVYRIVANNRHRLPGSTDACKL